MDMVRVLYMNPSKCFSRKNNKNYTKSEAIKMLDNTLEELGVNYQRQYELIKGSRCANLLGSVPRAFLWNIPSGNQALQSSFRFPKE